MASARLHDYINHPVHLFQYPRSFLPRDRAAGQCIPCPAVVSTKKVWLFTRALPRSSSLAQQPVGPSLGTLASTGWDRCCPEPHCHHPGRDSSSSAEAPGARWRLPAFVQPRSPASVPGSLGTPSLCFGPRRGPEAPPSGQSPGARPSRLWVTPAENSAGSSVGGESCPQSAFKCVS